MARSCARPNYSVGRAFLWHYPTNTFANLTVSEAVLGDPCLSLMCVFTSTLHPGAATGDD